ncbi:MAG TPA: cupin domain-containing protein [Candidatus Eisenbacteria bacterium]|nr:cupin domain-containing protein [Candidatus Eisenbacteria bacterium]
MKYKNHTAGEIVVKKDYSKKVIFSLADFLEKGHLLQEIVIPSQTKQRLHKHFKLTEVWYVLQGETSIFINNEEFIAHPGDAFIASPGDTHQLWNKTNEDFRLVVFKINVPENDEDTEWLEE